jgi:hypothetical protein
MKYTDSRFVELSFGASVDSSEQIEDCGQSHILTFLFHRSREKLLITNGLVEPSGCGTHWIKVSQFSGFGYKQFFGPLQPVASIYASEQVNTSAGVSICGVGFGVVVVVIVKFGVVAVVIVDFGVVAVVIVDFGVVVVVIVDFAVVVVTNC